MANGGSPAGFVCPQRRTYAITKPGSPTTSGKDVHAWIRRFQKQAPALGMSLAPTGERFVVADFVSHALGMLESIGWIAARRFLFSGLRFQLLGWPAFLSSAEAVPPHLDQRGCNSERSRSGLQRTPLAPGRVRYRSRIMSLARLNTNQPRQISKNRIVETRSEERSEIGIRLYV